MAGSGLWADVGAQLAEIRARRGYKDTNAVFKACGKPAHKTMLELEKGRVKTLSTLDEYCEVLGTSTADVLRAVLAPQAALDADAIRVAWLYQVKSVQLRVRDLQRAMRLHADLIEEALRLEPPGREP
jgi:transcriptional regulator with XRE-family HTH domain